MQTANVLLSLGGDHGNTVMKWAITAAEIAVLREIHGDESVRDVEPVGEIKRGHRQERERLVAIYGGAKRDDKRIVEMLFPGVAARVFEDISELDLPEEFFKATTRLNAESAARPVVDPGGGPTVAEWVASGYSASAYPPSGYHSKSSADEIAAAIAAEAAKGEAEDDADAGVGDDIDDGIGGTEANNSIMG